MVDDLQGEQFVVSGLNSTAEEQAKNGIQSYVTSVISDIKVQHLA